MKGNRNWMRRPRGAAGLRPDPRRPRAALPDLHARGVATRRRFDEVLELLHLGGRSLPHAVLMMIPEAWENHAEMDPARRAFYEFHSTLMEPWDGPACVAFTDGTLDRRGARPQRPAPRPLLGHRRRPGRARPPRSACSTSTRRTVVAQGPAAAGPDVPRRHRRAAGSSSDEEIKAELAAEHPYDEWLHAGLIQPRRPARARAHRAHRTPRSPGASRPSATPRRSCASSSRRWPGPAPSRSARWAPTRPIAVLSDRPRLLFDYFTQLFAQVTNPPLDAIREELVTSLGAHASARRATCSTPTPASLPPGRAAVPGHRQRRAGQDRPHQRRRRPARLRHARRPRPVPTSPAAATALRGAARARSAPRSSEAIADGARFIVLSDRDSDADLRADPVAAAHRAPCTTT